MPSSIVLPTRYGRYASDPQPQKKVNAGNLDSDVGGLFKFTADAKGLFDAIMRDDNQLKDGVVRYFSLNPEVLTILNLQQGWNLKEQVRVAAPAHVNISNPGTAIIDNVTLTNGDRVLLANESSKSMNGIYQFNGSSSPMTRTDDASTGALLLRAYVAVSEGDTQAGTGWQITNETAPVIGTDSITVAKVLTGGGGGGSSSVVATGTHVIRSIADRFADVHNVSDYGAIGDGSSHQLNTDDANLMNLRYSVYGLSASAGDEWDTVAHRAALLHSSNTGRPVYSPHGTYRIDSPLQLNWTGSPISGQPGSPKVSRWFGDGSMTQLVGYGIAAGRGIVELLGVSNILAVNIDLSTLDIIADTSCNVGSYCLRMGDAKQSFSGHRLRLFGANCLRLKTASVSSYANLCTSFENCTFISNYQNGWGADSGFSGGAVDHETVAGPTGTWADAVRFASCLFGGRVKSRAYTALYENCLFYTAATRPAPYNYSLDVTYGAATLNACYFEDHHTAVHVQPTEGYIQNVTLTGCLLGGSPIYGATYGVRAIGDNTKIGNGIGHVTLLGCEFDSNYSSQQVSFDRCNGQLIDCYNKSLPGDPLTVETLNGAMIIESRDGGIKIYGGVTTRAGFERNATVVGALFDNLGNYSDDPTSTYSLNILSDTAIGTITVYSSTFTAIPALAGAIYIGNGNPDGQLVLGQNGSLDVAIKDGRVRIGNGVDDDTGIVQINGPITLLATTQGSFTDGLMWNHHDQAALAVQVNGSTQIVSTVPFGTVNVADITVGNTLSELTIFGAKAVAAGFWKVGKTVRLTLRGFLSSTGTPTLNIKVKFGTVQLVATGAVAQVGTPSNIGFVIEVDITCRSVGATGTLYAEGFFKYGGNMVPLTATAVATVDTTASKNLDVTATWGALNVGNTLTTTIAYPQVHQ